MKQKKNDKAIRVEESLKKEDDQTQKMNKLFDTRASDPLVIK